MGLNIYFCGSIRGGRQDGDIYAKLIEHLNTHGRVVDENVGYPNVLQIEMDKCAKQDNHEKLIHDRSVNWLLESDVLVAEVTQTSMGVGFEIGYAESIKKPILCLYRKLTGKSVSSMVLGGHNEETFVVKQYAELHEAFHIIDEFLAAHKK